jgi:hypothetical protein
MYSDNPIKMMDIGRIIILAREKRVIYKRYDRYLGDMRNIIACFVYELREK